MASTGQVAIFRVVLRRLARRRVLPIGGRGLVTAAVPFFQTRRFPR